MGSLFFSSIGIIFSDRYNARYGQQDLFRHLAAMRGRHGYAEGTSNVEDVDGSTPPLPSGRWTLGKIRSVPEDRMLARCDQMIRRAVKRLRRHGLLRKPVELAIDFHDICRYDKNPNMKFMRHSKYKNGTRLFNTLATVHCVTGQSRACLIIRPARGENDARETATGTTQGKSESAYHMFATNVPQGWSQPTRTGSSRHQAALGDRGGLPVLRAGAVQDHQPPRVGQVATAVLPAAALQRLDTGAPPA